MSSSVRKRPKTGTIEERFTADELAQFRDAFLLFDRDKSGAIDMGEFGMAAAEFGVEVTQEELDDILKQYDADGSGQIDFNEFVLVMAAKLHMTSSDSDSGSEGDVLSEEDHAAMSGVGHHSSLFDAMPRPELVAKSAYLGKMASDIVDVLGAAEAQQTTAPTDSDHGGVLEAMVVRVAKALRTQRKVLPSDLPAEIEPIAECPAHTTVAVALGLSGAAALQAPSWSDLGTTILCFVRDCIAAIDEKVATMEELETVSLDGRAWRRRPLGMDDTDSESAAFGFCVASGSAAAVGPSLVRREAGGGGEVKDAAAFEKALAALTGFTFDVAGAACSDARAPVARHMRDIVGAFEDGQSLLGAIAYRWYVRNRLRFGICPVDPVCEQLDLADALYTELEQLSGGKGALKPRCEKGLSCPLITDPKHCLSLAHPCFLQGPSTAASLKKASAASIDPVESAVALCPLAADALHMACYFHAAKNANATDNEARLSELRARQGMVDLTDRGITDAACEALAFVLHRDGQRNVDGDTARHYTHVCLARNAISPVGARRLLAHANELVHLDLSRNVLGRRGDSLVGEGVGGQLLKLLQRSATLTHLDISSNGLSDADGVHIAEALKTNVVLRTLIMRNNHFGRITAAELAVAMSYNRELHHVDLSYNRFDSTGCVALLEELCQSSTLEIVDMSWTGVGDDSATFIAELLASSAAIRHLRLAHNNITRKGIATIAKALGPNKTLTHLDVRHNALGDIGAGELLRELQANTTLEHLDLRDVRASEALSTEVGRLRASNNIGIAFDVQDTGAAARR